MKFNPITKPVVLEYTGPIPELQGQRALTVRTPQIDNGFVQYAPTGGLVMAQFDKPITFNGAKLNLGWHPFTPSQFTPIGSKPVF